MKAINGTHHHLVISEEVALYGMAESGRVVEGGYLQLCGTVTERLVVEAGATADIHGTVSGSLICHPDSVVTISGVVAKLVGTANIQKDAIVGGTRY